MINKDVIWKETFILLTQDNAPRFTEITVRDLCTRVGIHRSTFYRHFESKDDVIKYGISVLWSNYYNDFSEDTLKTPFQTSEVFFLNSNARKLIACQQRDTLLLELIKNITLTTLENHYRQFISIEKELKAGFLVSTIDYLDRWNQQHTPKNTPKMLDDIFQSLCSHVLTNIEKNHS